ncbi:MAG: transcription elongation factor GreA [Oscillospiraceae bacterium]|nr:transcription elongation factor GreA [Oscillospiraceae bacterium]
MNKPITVLTRAGEEKLKAELDELKSVRRHEVAEKIKVALSFGDLSENSEYDEAKNEQGIIESRIAEIEQVLAHSQVIDDDDISTEKVGIGTTVKLLDMDMDEEMEFRIVGTKEADIDSGRMSDESPIGRAIMNREVGEEVIIEVPDGEAKMKILEIRKDD